MSFAGSRVVELQSRRMEEMAAQRFDLLPDRGGSNRVFATLAVRCVPNDRMSRVRHVNANLMCASSLQLNPQQCELLKAFLDFKDRVSRPAGIALQHGHSRPIPRAASYAFLDLASRLYDAAIDERRVLLDYPAISKSIG